MLAAALDPADEAGLEALLTEVTGTAAERGEARRRETRLVALAYAMRDTARRHPAVFPLLLSRPAVTPAARAARDAHFAGLLRWLRLALTTSSPAGPDRNG